MATLAKMWTLFYDSRDASFSKVSVKLAKIPLDDPPLRISTFVNWLPLIAV